MTPAVQQVIESLRGEFGTRISTAAAAASSMVAVKHSHRAFRPML